MLINRKIFSIDIGIIFQVANDFGKILDYPYLTPHNLVTFNEL